MFVKELFCLLDKRGLCFQQQVRTSMIVIFASGVLETKYYVHYYYYYYYY
jgi:hypothetical protein